MECWNSRSTNKPRDVRLDLALAVVSAIHLHFLSKWPRSTLYPRMTTLQIQSLRRFVRRSLDRVSRVFPSDGPLISTCLPLVVLTAYLFAYNALSTLAWLYPLVVVVLHLSGVSRAQVVSFAPPAVKAWAAGGLPVTFGYGPANDINPFPWAPKWLLPVMLRTQTTFSIVGEDVKWIQTAAVLEILHSLLGWVRSPLTTTLMQVFSRVVLVWGIADQHPSVGQQLVPLYFHDVTDFCSI